MSDNYSKADMRILGEVVNLDTLKGRIERFETVEEGLTERRAMQQEITTLGKFVQSSGFTPGRDMQRVASIPSSVWSAVLEVFPEAGVDKQLFYALLAGPLKEYDIRFKNILS